MSLTQTYFLAHTARAKLARQAARADHDLRLLVGHANLLDSLMLELADAEREQERWFNQSVRGANRASEEPRHIQWTDTLVEEPEEDWDPEDASSDSDSDSDDSDCEESDDLTRATAVAFTRMSSPSNPTVPRQLIRQEQDEEEDDDEEEDYDNLALTRVSSHQQPPELLNDSDDSSEDESMPPSPPQPSFNHFSEKEREAIVTTGFYNAGHSHTPNFSIPESDQSTLFDEGYYLPRREPAAMIQAY